jgi:hypothetical protein
MSAVSTVGMASDPNAADWVIAVASTFAALGTVGAVVVALWQILSQGRRSLVVKCSLCVIADVQSIRAVSLRGTNDGPRPIKLTMAYLMSQDGQQVVSPLLPHGDRLPKVLLDGESVDVFWDQTNLLQVKNAENVRYMYAFFMDVLGNIYETPYPGVTVKRKGIRRRKDL